MQITKVFTLGELLSAVRNHQGSPSVPAILLNAARRCQVGEESLLDGDNLSEIRWQLLDYNNWRSPDDGMQLILGSVLASSKEAGNRNPVEYLLQLMEHLATKGPGDAADAAEFITAFKPNVRK